MREIGTLGDVLLTVLTAGELPDGETPALSNCGVEIGFVLGRVEPAAVLGRVVNGEAPPQAPDLAG